MGLAFPWAPLLDADCPSSNRPQPPNTLSFTLAMHRRDTGRFIAGIAVIFYTRLR